MVVSYFIPEIGSAAHVYFDLARAFVKKGHEVDVLTSYPREFNLGKEDISKEFPLEEIIDGVRIHRCKHYAKRDNIALRGFEHFLLSRYYFKRFKEIDKKFEVCLIYIPPLPLYYFACKIKKHSGIPSVLNIQDFHPQELTDVGILKNWLMIRVMKHIERKSYENADYITVLSKGGVDYVVERGGDPNKIKHIYNGILLSDFEKYKAKKDFKKKQRIEDKFLVSYAGILSPFQGVDNILDAAKKFKGNKDLMFYIVGDGMNKDHLEKRIQSENISNIRLIPFQPRDEYFNIINSSDISIVSLDNRMKAPCIPGKLVNLMGMEQPIIASVPSNSEVARVVKHSGCGFIVEPGLIDELAKKIIYIKKNVVVRSKMGQNGYNFLKQNMDLQKNIQKYESIFVSIIK